MAASSATDETGNLVLIDCLDDAARAFQAVRIKLDCSCDARSIKACRMNLRNISTEPKRRNVYRAAVAYRVVAWFLTPLPTHVFPFFDVPNSTVRFVVIVLAA